MAKSCLKQKISHILKRYDTEKRKSKGWKLENKIKKKTNAGIVNNTTRKENWEKKPLYRQFKRWRENYTEEESWHWQCRGHLKRKIEFLMILLRPSFIAYREKFWPLIVKMAIFNPCAMKKSGSKKHLLLCFIYLFSNELRLISFMNNEILNLSLIV